MNDITGLEFVGQSLLSPCGSRQPMALRHGQVHGHSGVHSVGFLRPATMECLSRSACNVLLLNSQSSALRARVLHYIN